jgi:hypothetical protein
MAIKIFQLPKKENEGFFPKMITHANTPFNDRIFLVTIQWWGCVEW